jgi:hypothetical protein
MDECPDTFGTTSLNRFNAFRLSLISLHSMSFLETMEVQDSSLMRFMPDDFTLDCALPPIESDVAVQNEVWLCPSAW